MSPFAFTSRARNLTAALLSAAALITVGLYVTAPVDAQPAIVAASQAARHPMLLGLVKGNPRTARVTLVFRDAHGRVLAVRHPHVARNGRWRMAIPRGAVKVVVTVRDGGRLVRAVERIVPGHSLSLTAMFGGRRTGLIPGLLPY